ncbi:MAG: LysM peptidoglycan-binding domain-containing protein [Planctomycetaceae bacterium]|nr:LysM peptidoglycan-binding domain-containing protein [Planctomycetaceae bacterium]
MDRTHTVVRGDTLSGIAKQFGFRYWQNIYFAQQNNSFREKRPNPNRIEIGDQVVIPTKDQVIIALESKASKRYHRIPLFTQPDAATCWRASAKMVYLWKHGRSAETRFNERIGSSYAAQASGLNGSQWRDFFVSRLGMLWTDVSCENLLHYILAVRSPVVAFAYTTDPNNGHAVVIAGYNLFSLQWYVLNPFSGASYDFNEDGTATYTAGPATEQNMGYWGSINELRFRGDVFHF